VLPRVVLAAISLLSLGMLAWVPLLWLAAFSRRTGDWIRCAVVAAASAAAIVLAGYTDNEDDWQTNAGVCTLIVLAVGGALYFVVVDLWRHAAAGSAVPSPSHESYLPPSPPHQPWYAADQPQPVYPPAPYALPAPSGSGRIDQVRAELDELSDYLRSQGEDR
jgi:hypothetical protein